MSAASALSISIARRPPPEAYVHTDILGVPLVDAGAAHAMLAAQLGDWNAGLVLLQDTDDLLFGKSGSFHLWSSLGQSLLQTGLDAGGNVRGNVNITEL